MLGSMQCSTATHVALAHQQSDARSGVNQLTNGQPSGTQEAVTVDSTDSAATETIITTVMDNPTPATPEEQVKQAIAAEAAAAETWVREHLGSMPASIRVSRVPVDTVQLFATAGMDFNSVVRDSITAVKGIQVGQVYELFSKDQLNYASVVTRKMDRVKQLASNLAVNASYAYSKAYLKQRQLVKVVEGLQTNAKGEQYYVVHTGTLDPERPLDEPTWRAQDMVAKQAGELRIYLVHTQSGDALWRWHNGNKQVVALGSSEVVADRIATCLQSEQYKLLQEIGASNPPELQDDDIRRNYEGQLVFWQATHLANQATLALESAPSAS